MLRNRKGPGTVGQQNRPPTATPASHMSLVQVLDEVPGLWLGRGPSWAILIISGVNHGIEDLFPSLSSLKKNIQAEAKIDEGY